MPSIKDDRIASAKANGRTDNPCVRCINKMARDGAPDVSGTCHMLIDDSLRRGMQEEGIRYTKCAYCLRSGEKCFELPVSYEKERVALEAAVDTALARAVEDDPASQALSQEKLKKQASDIIKFIQAEGKIPYDDHLYAHSGLSGKIGETGVCFERRARSKADRAKAEAKKRKMEEAESDEDDMEQTPSKKKKYGVKGVRITEAERARREAEAARAGRARKRAEEDGKAAGIREKATRDRTNAEKKWLTAYNKKRAQEERARAANGDQA